MSKRDSHWSRSCARLLLALALATVTSLALAQTPALRDALNEGARRDYDAALSLYESGDFSGAERRFSIAFASSGDVRLLWNAAACEQGQRHYAKAIALMNRYLDSGSPLIGEQEQRNARAFLDAALPLTARIVVEANEAGSNVYLDGELLGGLPLAPETRVDFGPHRLVVRKPQFVDEAQTIMVASSDDLRLRFELRPVKHQGRLLVRAGAGDSIAIDGHFRALGAFDGVLPSGLHRLRVTAHGSRPYENGLVIEDERTRALDVTLSRTPLTSRLPTWLWVAGGAALLAGAGTAAYFIARSPDSGGSLPSGTAGKVQLPLR